MPTSETRTQASMTMPLSSTRSRTSMRLVPPGVRSTGMSVPLLLLAAAAAGPRRRRRRDALLLELDLQLGDARLEPPDHLVLVSVGGRRVYQALVVAPPVQSDLLR